jgi:type VI secretion system secreted protein VgrG
MPSVEAFRPVQSSIKSLVRGPQTAVVVGPAGEEIYTDKFGRVKVQFHWDRVGKKDENSSCWVRVSHPWAGKNWGMVALPRIGQEVIVDFLEGDPDRPIITGRVYNAEQMPPYTLPGNMTQTGIKSRSTKQGTPDNFNEFRFEDKKGQEQVYVHAEKDFDGIIEHNETRAIGNDRSKTVGHDETVSVSHDRNESVGNNEGISIGVNRSLDVGSNATTSVGANRSITVGKDESHDVSGKRQRSVGKDESVEVGENLSETVGKNVTVSIGENQTLSVGKDSKSQIGKKYYLEAGDEITLKTGDASITMKKDGSITIKGKDITIEGSGKIGVKASGDVVIKGSKIANN